MSTALQERPAQAGAGNGGAPARRAVTRWAWRLFRREWRQQSLILSLIIVAVGATVVGAAVATNTPPRAGAGFGTAQSMAVFQAPDPHLASQIAALEHRFGRADVIENQNMAVPGSVSTFQLRAQNPHGPFGQPLLSLVSGHYPAGPGQVALTPGLAADLNLTVGDVWQQGGNARRVVGIVQNPQSLLDEFALVTPGQVTAPTEVTVLFDAHGAVPRSLRPFVQGRTSRMANSSNPLNPETIMLALATVAMLLITLVATGGFTVLAQRRMRSLGMLASLGATDRHIRRVVRINGVLVGVTGAVAGAVLGLAVWLAYRPRVEADAHHVIAPFSLPWLVIGVAMVLAVIATWIAASRPARSITRVPIVSALSGRPAPPKQVHRTALPGLIALAGAALLLAYTGTTNGNGGKGQLTLVLGFVALIAAVILLAPFCLTVMARLGRRAPIATRLALRDLSRYRARSGSALSAISLGVLIAALICVVSAQRFGNVLDYAGPNLASNQIIVYTPNGPSSGGPSIGGPGPGGPGPGQASALTPAKLASMAARARSIAAALGSHDVIQLELTSGYLQHAAAGRQFGGSVYVATPQLLGAFGIKASQIDPRADILTMRPGLSGMSKMQLIYGNYYHYASPGGYPDQTSFPCPKSACLANPVIQEVSALPSGTSAPNTVITEHAIRTLGLHPTVSDGGWLIQLPHPPTASQISSARLAASAAGMNVETKNSIPTSSDIINWATVFGMVLALGILGMSVGLIRSETASDLRTLAATGASGVTRRAITAATAGALGLAGAVLGTVAAYVAAIGYASSNKLDSLSELSNVPTVSLLLILIGMPAAAAIAGWLLGGREQRGMAHQPIE